MPIAKQALTALQAAEQRLRELVASAAAAGEYDAIQQATEWARILGTMVREAKVATGAGQAANASSGKLGELSPAIHSDKGELDPANASLPRRIRRAPAKGEYPKFVMHDDHLVKIGWSKKTKGEYEHKAPRRVVDALAAAIAKRNGKVFTVEDLLPLKDLQDQSEIPGYQAYVVLAWLKLAGLVKQHGRRGYSIKKTLRLTEAASSLWLHLPEKF